MNKMSLLMSFATFLALSISFNVNAKTVLNSKQAVAADGIAEAIMQNNKDTAKTVLYDNFRMGLWKYEDAEAALALLNVLGEKIVSGVLSRSNGQTSYLHNDAGQLFAQMIFEREDKLTKHLSPNDPYLQRVSPYWKVMLQKK